MFHREQHVKLQPFKQQPTPPCQSNVSQDQRSWEKSHPDPPRGRNGDTLSRKTVNTCPRPIEDCKVEPEDRIEENLGRSKDCGSVNCQIHGTSVLMPHHPTRVTRTTSILESSLIEPTNVTYYPRSLEKRLLQVCAVIRHWCVSQNVELPEQTVGLANVRQSILKKSGKGSP